MLVCIYLVILLFIARGGAGTYVEFIQKYNSPGEGVSSSPVFTQKREGISASSHSADYCMIRNSGFA